MHDINTYLDKYFGEEISHIQKEKFMIYYETLIQYNAHTNLTSITEPIDVVIKHFYDSVWFMKILNEFEHSPKVLDLGSGAGFPGVPLKIMNDNIQLDALDSIKKKTVFLEHLKTALNINFNAINKRAEEHLKLSKNKYDIIVFRAVGKLNPILTICKDMIRSKGIIVALKSQNVYEEIEEFKKTEAAKNLLIDKIHNIQLPEDKGLRNIVVLRKK
jgi:16S rRNA (guanine527-N7)-methyltransferase